MTDVILKPITAEDVAAREALEDTAREIINGEWAEELDVPSEKHNLIAGEVFALLRDYVKKHGLGRVYGDQVNFVLKGTPEKIEVMRVPDAAFVSKERLKPIQDDYLYMAPDLAIEVVSKSELKQKKRLAGKVADYLTYGAKQVWVLYQHNETLVVHYPDGGLITYTRDEVLDGGDVLPNFSIQVGKFFEVE